MRSVASTPHPSTDATVLTSRALFMAGAFVGGLAGALAGLTEATVATAAIRSFRTFSEVFGYAILLDAAIFGLAGSGLTALAGAILRTALPRADPDWGIAVGGVLVCLLVSSIFLFTAATGPGGESARAAHGSVPVGLAWAGCAVLLGLLLAPRPVARHSARVFAFRIAPALLALVVSIAAVGVGMDLHTHGLTLSGTQEHVGARGPSGPLPAVPHQPLPPVQPPTSAPPPAAAPLAAPGPTADRDAPAASETAAESDRPAPVAPAVADPAPLPANSQHGAPAPRRPNVLLITVDTLRADHLGAYGYRDARTPTLDRLAAEGVLVRQAYTSRNGTTPAHAGIFTGSYPARHGIRSHMFDLLSPNVTTIAEAFAGDGYTTAGLYSWLAFEPAYSGLDRGFQTYTDLTVNLPSYLTDTRTSALAATYKRLKSVLLLPGAVDRQMAFSADIEERLDGKADITTDAALLWLQEHRAAEQQRDAPQPFFLWVHYWDPHYPFTPPSPFDDVRGDGCDDCPDGSIPTIRAIQWGTPLDARQTAHLIRYYDGEIAFVDQELGRLFDGLAALGLDQNTAIVVMGDHGESFGEQERWLHGFDLLEPEIHVPLILRFPEAPNSSLMRRRVDAAISHVDVMPTLLEYAGVPIPQSVEGRSLLPVIRGEDNGDDRYAVAELADRTIVSYVTREWQLLVGPEQAVRLFRVTPEGHGQDDLSMIRVDAVIELGWRLATWQAAHP